MQLRLGGEAIRLHNTLSQQKEQVTPREPNVVRMYTCGPTVYRNVHIGNLRSYLLSDWLRRALECQGYEVRHVKNITDVGHMRQERLERGEDKIISAALGEGKTPQEIAHLYTEAFLRDEAKVNILPAHHFPRATDHIAEMQELIQRLLERDLAYQVEGNVYFAVGEFSEYGKLSGNRGQALLEAVRVEADPHKRDPRDFTLWKAAEPGRMVKWSSPWGEGFPGWHIECSAMSTKYLGEQLDIHTGGVDNIFPHHEGEIAQSEGAFGKPFVKYWVHGQHLLADGMKMAKSLGNSYTLEDLETRGYDPVAFRYLCLTTHYQSRLNFTFSALRAAQRGLMRLRQHVWEWRHLADGSPQSEAEHEQWRGLFWEHVNDNLHMPGALAVTWQLVRSKLPPLAKLSLLLEFDKLLGLGLERVPELYQVPPPVEETVRRHQELRETRLFAQSDDLRHQMIHQGYVVHDMASRALVRPKTEMERRQERWPAYSSSREVPSMLEEPDAAEFSVNIIACNYRDDAQRCVGAALKWGAGHRMEVVVVDNGSTDGTAEWLEETALRDGRLRVIHIDHILGHAAAQNVALKQSRGTYIIQVDPSAEITGDIFAPLKHMLSDSTVGVAGPFGLRTEDLHHFDESAEPGEVDAMQAYCFAFRRQAVQQVGLMRETFRFYRNLDLEYSFRFRDAGYRLMNDPSLPLQRHEHRVWSDMTEEERHHLSFVNFKRFAKKFGHRHDLLVSHKT